MSPEQAAGKPVDLASDLFSLGAVLYLLCTGRRPFNGTKTFAILTALATEVPTPVAELNPDVPPPLADLVRRLLEKDPACRPASAREVAEAIYALERRRLIERLERESAGGLNTVGGSQVVNLNPEESAESRLEFDPPSDSARPRHLRPPLLVGALLAVTAVVAMAAVGRGLIPSRLKPAAATAELSPGPSLSGGGEGPAKTDLSKTPVYFLPAPRGIAKEPIPADRLRGIKGQLYYTDPTTQYDLNSEEGEPVVTSKVEGARLYFGERQLKNYYLRFEFRLAKTGPSKPRLAFSSKVSHE